MSDIKEFLDACDDAAINIDGLEKNKDYFLFKSRELLFKTQDIKVKEKMLTKLIFLYPENPIYYHFMGLL